MDRIREFLIWMKPHRIVKQVCRLNVHFNYSVDRSYMEMQQYTETLHSRMNQLQDERDDLLSRVESIERENRHSLDAAAQAAEGRNGGSKVAIGRQ